MKFELNAVYAPKALDLEEARRRLAACSDDELVAQVGGDPLQVPWSIAPDVEAPWVGEGALEDAAARFGQALSDGLTPAMALASIAAADRGRFVAAVRMAAEQWITNIGRLVHGEDPTFERRYANRRDVAPAGSIVFCPEDYETPEPTDANIYGEVLSACRDVFPGIAAWLQVFSLDDCEVTVHSPAARN